MVSREFRSFLPLRNPRNVRAQDRAVRHGGWASMLASRVGRALGVGSSTGMSMVDRLEERTLLEGSPTNPLPLTPGADGRFSAVQAISSPTDIDFYEFIAPADAFVSVLADTTNEANRNLDSTVRVTLGSTGAVVAQGADNGTLTSGFQKDGWAGFLATAGTRYIIEVAGQFATTGPYTLRMRGTNATFDVGGLDNRVPAPQGPGQLGINFETGTPAPSITGGNLTTARPVLGQLGGTGPVNSRTRQDEIIYRWTAGNTAADNTLVTISAQSTEEGNLTQRLDTHIDLYDQNGVLIASDQQSGRINDAFLAFRATQGQTYYIRIRSDEVTTQNISLATGPFFLLLDARPDTFTLDRISRRGTSVGQFLSYNNPTIEPSPAMPRPVFQTQSWSFVSEGTGTAIITIVGAPPSLAPDAPLGAPPPAFMTNPALRVYDDAGNNVGFADDVIGLNPQLELQLIGGRRYFMVIDGFELNAGQAYRIFAEANTTVTPTNDDHPDLVAGATVQQQRRNLGEATALPWSDPFVTLDADGNVVRDRGLRVTAVGEGRLEPRVGSVTPDTDVFQFTPPADMLFSYDGNNDDNGTSLFFGGAFDIMDRGLQFPNYSTALAGYDGGDWFATGTQRTFTANGQTFQLGFIDNPLTPATNGPVVHATLDWQPFLGEGTARPRRLVVAGDFLYQFVNPLFPAFDPRPVLQLSNVAVHQLLGGRYQINTQFTNPASEFIGFGTDGPVFALAEYNPVAFDPDGDGPIPTLPDPGQSSLYLGGNFTGTVDDTLAVDVPATNLVRFNLVQGYAELPLDNLFPETSVANGPVRAFTVYDPEDPGEGREEQEDPFLSEVADSPDTPPSLIIGGSFGQGIISWNGVFRNTLTVGSDSEVNPPPFGNIDGEVFSLSTYELDFDGANGLTPYVDAAGNEFDIDPLANDDPVQILMIGGNFTGVDGSGASSGLLGWGAIRTGQDPEEENFAPALEFVNFGLEIAGQVNALTVWNQPSTVPGGTALPVLVLGGQFTEGTRSNLGRFTQASIFDVALTNVAGSTGANGPVFALAAFSDDDEPLEVGTLDSGSANQTLYVGGDFTQLNFPPGQAPLLAENLAYVNAVTGAIAPDDSLSWSQVGPPGVTGTVGVDYQQVVAGRNASVRAITSFDDGLAGTWDRHDRPAARLALELTGTFSDIADFQIQVLDSNFNVVYGAGAGGTNPGATDLAEPPDADPDNPGMRDPSLGRVNRDTQFDGITVVGGQVYYLVVRAAGQGTGRYQFSMTADAGPRRVQLNRDGTLTPNNALAPADVNASLINLPRAFGGNRGQFTGVSAAEESIESNFTGALRRQLSSGFNDADLLVNRGSGATLFNESRQVRELPSERQAPLLRGSQGLIQTIDDTDFYFFRAARTGVAEVRVSTASITDVFSDSRVDYRFDYPPIAGVGAQIVDGETIGIGPYESNLDSALRIFSNDFTQIAYNDDNSAFDLSSNSDRDVSLILAASNGAPLAGEFNRRDARVLFPVVADQVYYIQVESAQRWRVPNPPEFYDNVPDPTDPRVANTDPEIDWRFATGSYQLFINTPNDQASDVEGGTIVIDDHVDIGPGFITDAVEISATNIVLGTDPQVSLSNGIGSRSGVINNTPNKPVDSDIFKFTSPAEGDFVINFTRASGSSLIANVFLVLNDIFQANPTNTGNGGFQFQGRASLGDEFYIIVQGVGASEGGYNISVQTQASVDDFGDKFRWWEATDVQLEDASGSGFVAGRLETSDDTDLFRFEISNFDLLDVTVRPVDATLRPRVTVYEVSEIPVTGAGGIIHPFHLQIASSSRETPPPVGQPTTVRASVQALRQTAFAAPNDRVYRYYYVVVEGFDPQADVGRYELLINFSSTDDHPDATDLDANDVYDTSQFAFATQVNVDPLTGTAASNGSIEVGTDTDLFQFEVPASGPVSVSLTRALGSSFRGRISIVDATGTLLGTRGVLGDDASTDPVSASVAFVTRGTRLFFVVEPIGPFASTTPTGAYSVNVVTASVDDHANQGEFSSATAIQLLASNGRGQLGGSSVGANNPRINSGADTDLFYFFSIAAGSHTVTITPLSSNSQGLRPRVTIFQGVFNTQGTEVSQTLIGSFDATTALAEATFTFNVSNVGSKYYVLVTPLSGMDTITPAEYRVAVQGPIPTDPPEGGDTGDIDFNAPTTIVLNDRTGDGSTLRQGIRPQLPIISPAGDRDLYSFTTIAPGRVFVRLSLPSGSTLLGRIDVFRRLADSSIVAVGSDEINNFGSAARLDFPSAAGQEYLVIVDAPGDSTGSYILEVDTQPLVNRLVYPEGYSTNFISEFIPIVNPNPFPINYTIKLFYAFPDANGGRLVDTFATRTIGAQTRDGVTINAPINGVLVQDGPVRQDVPYSLVVEYQYPTTFVNAQGQTVSVDPATIQPLGATLSHYDFGSSTGDAFTSRVEERWAFPRLERAPGAALNYVVVWNPQDYAVDMQLLVSMQDGRQFTLPGANQWRRIEANRREGFGIDDFAELGTGVFSAVLQTRVAPEANGTTDPAKAAVFEGVVAAVSAYRIVPGQEAAFGAIGDADFGSRRGAITNLTQGNGVTSELVIFNPNNQPASVTISSQFIRTGIPGFARQINVGPNRSVVIDGSTLGITPGQPVGITYTSNLDVSVQSVQFQRGDADSASPRYAAGNRFLFGDAFIDARTAGRQYFETLWFYNPTSVTNTVSVRLLFFNNPSQPTSTISINLPANGFGEIRLHERPEVISATRGPTWFAIDASSDLPFMVSLEHYDLFLGGGWSASGVPFGIETPLDQFA